MPITIEEATAILQAAEVLAPLGEEIIAGVQALIQGKYGAESWPALIAECQANLETLQARGVVPS